MSNAVAAIIVTLFPFLLPVWQERPIVPEDIRPGPYPMVVNPEVLALQKEAFAVGDAEYRARLAGAVRQAGTAEAGELLLGQLGKETDGQVIGAILEQAAQLPGDAVRMQAAARGLWTHAQPEVRLGAVRLYGAAKGPAHETLRRLARGDTWPAVRRAAWEVLVSQAADADNQTFFKSYWMDAEAGLRAVSLAASAATAGAGSDRTVFVSACGDPSPEVRYRLAVALDRMPRPLGLELARKLAGDSHASVRVATADALGRMAAPELVPVLLELTEDRDTETRLLAVQSLRRLPQPATVAKAIAHFTDASAQVRKVAEETVVILHQKEPVIAALAEHIEHDEHYMRYHVCRALGRLKAKELAQRVFARLDQETLAENTGAVVFALGQMDARFAGAAVAERATHADAGVRKEVAVAIGRFYDPSLNETLRGLVFDVAAPVREAALLAIARLKDGWFNPTLLKVLKTVNGPEPISGADRRCACWLAANVKPYSLEVLKRIVVQATTPVIPVPMGPPMFEDDTVLIACEFALVQVARTDPAVRPLAEQVLSFHSAALVPPAGGAAPTSTLIPTDELKEYLRQAKAWYNNETIGQLPRPTWEITMPYRRVREPLPEE